MQIVTDNMFFELQFEHARDAGMVTQCM